MKKCLAAFVLVCASPLYAATPDSGTLNLETLELEYLSDVHVNANVVHQGDFGATGPTCQSPVLACEDFALTLDFPEDIAEVYPSAIVRIAWGWQDTTGAGATDFDCWVYDGDGNLLETSGAGSNNPESAAFLLNGGVSEYILRCAPYLAVGDQYTGTVEVRLGDPVEVAEGESSEGFAGVLVPSEKNSTGASAFTSGSGATLWLLPLLGLIGGLRRRS